MSEDSATNPATKPSSNHNFWMTALGGFVLGALAVILVLVLARRTGDKEPPKIESQPPASAAPAGESPTTQR